MKQSFDAVYENGVFRPVEPLPLVNGLRVSLTIGPPAGPLTPEQIEADLKLGHMCFEGMTEAEQDELEAAILGPQRMAQKKAEKH
jgi:predicted DNA-binding antitoxin AbrB/MazE fold protein